MGMVFFGKLKGVQQKPEFTTLRDLFNYCDPDESGNISMDEFRCSWDLLLALGPDVCGSEDVFSGLSFDDAWSEAAGESTHLTFAMFARWCSSKKIALPLGVDISDEAKRVCRFQYAGGRRCTCAEFTPQEETPNMCRCNHKSSVHMSDMALSSPEQQEYFKRFNRPTLVRKGTFHDRAERPGFDMVTNKETLEDLRQILNVSHKEHDNWTRDRGCALHGRYSCDFTCTWGHKAPVPISYELVRAERNRNAHMSQTFAVSRAAIREECKVAAQKDPEMFQLVEPESSREVRDTEPLDASSNEWRLLHGSSLENLKSICRANFRLKMAGTGATWKPDGGAVGSPLYGFGVYLAENSTKADEYSEPIQDSLPIDEGCHCMLVCRVVGGLCRVVDTNEFNTNELRENVFDGPYHSVFGNRRAKLGKPYNEMVVYDSAQVFPEFLLYYRRVF